MESMAGIIEAGMAIAGPVGSLVSLDEDMETLKQKCEDLYSREADVLTELEGEEESGRKRRRKEVENWLAKVAKTRNKLESLDEAVSQSRRLKRVKLVGRVVKLTKEVVELWEQREFPQGLTLNTRHTVGQDLLTDKLVGKAFKENLGKVLGYLEDPKVLSIGVWGMGGVGKTTLVTHINNRAWENKSLFDDVCWITVSQDLDMYKLQDQLAKAINLNFEDQEDIKIRGGMLSAMLKKRRRLFILDDVWDGFDWSELGNPVEAKGCKVIITTCNVRVCRKLGCQKKIKVERLSEKDAWDLFKENLRPGPLPRPQVLEVAEDVAKECAGLPLGIITVARCIREVNDVCEWRDALRALRESKDDGVEGMDDKVFRVLRFSYNRLNDPKAQDSFLYCALYPEDHLIQKEELIQRLIDEGVIGRMEDRQAQFYKGHAILNKLVNSCLLEAVGLMHKEYVKMHDLLRDMAIQMRNPQFVVKAGVQLRKLPDEEDWSKDVEKVSLMDNRMKEVAIAAGMWSKLSTLLLSGNTSLKRIEDSFFQHMPALRILDLTDCMKIQRLPDSVSNLKNLTALLLHGCSLLWGMPSLAELVSLKRLDLGSTAITEVPQGLEMLVNLTYLDVSRTKLEEFPSGILPQLLQLEFLKFSYGPETPILKGEELKKLERLSTFEGKLIFDDANGFMSYVMSRVRPARGPNCGLRFVLGGGRKSVMELHRRADHVNSVVVSGFSIGKTAPRTRKRAVEANVDVITLEALLQDQDVQSLELRGCNGAQNLCDVSWLDSATQTLKRFELWGCEGVQCLVPCSGSSPYILHKLEKLRLGDQEDLEVLFELGGDYRGETAIPSSSTLPPQPIAAGRVFSCLKILRVHRCSKIKMLFHPGFLPNLSNLQEISVDDCKALQEIITEGETSTSVEYALPNLRILSLRKLPELRGICAETICCASLCEIIVVDCPKLKRVPLSEPPSEFQSISVDPMEWWKSAEWDHPRAKDRFLPFRQDFDGKEYYTRVSDYY